MFNKSNKYIISSRVTKTWLFIVAAVSTFPIAAGVWLIACGAYQCTDIRLFEPAVIWITCSFMFFLWKTRKITSPLSQYKLEQKLFSSKIAQELLVRTSSKTEVLRIGLLKNDINLIEKGMFENNVQINNPVLEQVAVWCIFFDLDHSVRALKFLGINLMSHHFAQKYGKDLGLSESNLNLMGIARALKKDRICKILNSRIEGASWTDNGMRRRYGEKAGDNYD